MPEYRITGAVRWPDKPAEELRVEIEAPRKPGEGAARRALKEALNRLQKSDALGLSFIRVERLGEWDVQQYTEQYGWETVCCGETYREAYANLLAYRKEQPQYRVRIRECRKKGN